MNTSPAPVLPSPKVGDILVSSWGYDQTNIDYYEVVGVTKASVKIVAIGKTTVESDSKDFTSVEVVPLKGSGRGGKVLTRRFKPNYKNDGSYVVRISDYSSAWSWDGESRRETAAGYGH